MNVILVLFITMLLIVNIARWPNILQLYKYDILSTMGSH